jgi:hypothetical protein
MVFSFMINFTGKCFIALEYSKLETIFSDTFTRFQGYQHKGSLLPLPRFGVKTLHTATARAITDN